MVVGQSQFMTRTRIGLLIIRAWVEPGSSSPLRAQIRLSTDVTDGFERSLMVSQEDVAIQAVRDWLSEMLVGARDTSDDSDR
jgi:hypothetical protein